MMAGTPDFQSPEQLRAVNIGLPTDVYAFGCVLIVLFTEKTLWPGLTSFQIMLKVTVEEEKPSTLGIGNEAIKELCISCMEIKRPCINSVLQSLLSSIP